MMIQTILGINPAAIGAAIIAAIVFAGGIFMRGIKAGRDSEIAKDASAAQQAKSIESDNMRLSDEQVKQRLKEKWSKL